MLRITRAIEFSASLRYRREDLSEEQNQAQFGRSASQHGHNYRLEVSLCGEPDPVTGMLMDLKELKDILEQEVMARFDHRDLNSDTPYFEKRVPTPENLALVIREILLQALPQGSFDRLRLYQDENLWVDVIEENAK